jgi:hypothetical protein
MRRLIGRTVLLLNRQDCLRVAGLNGRLAAEAAAIRGIIRPAEWFPSAIGESGCRPPAACSFAALPRHHERLSAGRK